jgi:hypothetical protein
MRGCEGGVGGLNRMDLIRSPCKSRLETTSLRNLGLALSHLAPPSPSPRDQRNSSGSLTSLFASIVALDLTTSLPLLLSHLRPLDPPPSLFLRLSSLEL